MRVSLHDGQRRHGRQCDDALPASDPALGRKSRHHPPSGGPRLARDRYVEKRPKILVVFFSRTGTTRGVAEGIARATGADLEELREARSRLGILGWLRSGYEGTYRRPSEPLALQHELGEYDIVFIGSPTWSRSLSSPVRGFLEKYRTALPRVALFATCAGRGADEVLTQMASLLDQPALAKLALLELDVKHGPAVQVGELVETTLRAWAKSTSSVRPESGISA